MNIFVMDFRRGLRSLLVWTLATAAVLVLVVSLYPAMMNSDFMALMEEKIRLLPKELVDMFNISGEDIRELPSFFAWIFQFVLMAACLNGAIIGVSALAREQSEGTIEFLCAKPVRRGSIVSYKLVSACAQYVIYFAAVGIAGALACLCAMPAGTAAGDMLSRVASAVLGGCFAGLVYLFLGLLISVFLKRARAAVSLAVAAFFLTYVLGMLPSMGVLPFLKWISPINYFSPSQVVAAGGIEWGNALICLGAMAACAAAAYAVYRRKDFLV